MEMGEFDFQLMEREGKPFYIPDQEELLKYKDDNYFEVNKEYKALLEYATKHLADCDRQQAELIVEEIWYHCQYDFSPRAIFNVFNDQNVVFA